MTHHHKISLIFIPLLFLSATSVARYTITPTTPLLNNETLISSSGTFALGFFIPNPKNCYVGLWYNQIPVRAIVWVANRADPLVNSPGVLSITPDGTLTITDKNSRVVWSSNTTTKLTNPVGQLLDDGNLIVKERSEDSSTSNYAWQGFNYPTDTLLAGMKLGIDFTIGLNRTLISWSGPTDPTPGPFQMYVETQGDPELLLVNGTTRIWRSGPWDGAHFSGVPNQWTYQGFNFSFIKTDSSYDLISML